MARVTALSRPPESRTTARGLSGAGAMRDLSAAPRALEGGCRSGGGAAGALDPVLAGVDQGLARDGLGEEIAAPRAQALLAFAGHRVGRQGDDRCGEAAGAQGPGRGV